MFRKHANRCLKSGSRLIKGQTTSIPDSVSIYRGVHYNFSNEATLKGKQDNGMKEPELKMKESEKVRQSAG